MEDAKNKCFKCGNVVYEPQGKFRDHVVDIKGRIICMRCIEDKRREDARRTYGT